MKAQITLKGTPGEAATLSLAAYIAQNVLTGWETDAPGQAALIRVLGYEPEEDERRALAGLIEFVAVELPPVRAKLGPVQLELPDATTEAGDEDEDLDPEIVAGVRALQEAGATITHASPVV